MDNLDFLKHNDKDIINLTRISALLDWDMEVNLHNPGFQERATQTSLIKTLIHEKKTSKELEKSINDLLSKADKLSHLELKLVKDYDKIIQKAKKIPKDLVSKKAQIVSMAHSVWQSARKNNNYEEFLPVMEQILEILLQESDLIGYQDNPYDVHLDNFEPGATVKQIDKLFDPLEKEISDIVKVLSNRHSDIDDSFLYGNFDKEKQKQLSNFILNELRYDFSRGNFSEVFHPFCTTIGFNDVRVTTKFDEGFFNPSFWGTIHECGHALYEQNLPKQYQYSILGDAISLGIHESQSRFYENVIGKSRVFLAKYLPKIKEFFPQIQNKNISELQFYNAINKVQPSYIRIEADEVSYSLHIILRYKIEKMLLNKQLKLSQAQDMWNSEFKRLFGIEVDKASNGILQDVHWSSGILGYFPTYALGNLYYGQFSHQFEKELNSQNTNLETLIKNGEFKKILSWLSENIHQKGSTLQASELVKEVSGNELDSKYFINYLKQKFQV